MVLADSSFGECLSYYEQREPAYCTAAGKTISTLAVSRYTINVGITIMLASALNGQLQSNIFAKTIRHPVLMWMTAFVTVLVVPLGILLAFLLNHKTHDQFYLDFIICIMDPRETPFFWQMISTMMFLLALLVGLSIYIIILLRKIKSKEVVKQSGIRRNVIIRCLVISGLAIFYETWFCAQLLRARFTENYGEVDPIMMFLASQIGILTFVAFCSIKEVADHVPLFSQYLKILCDKIDGSPEPTLDRRQSIRRDSIITAVRRPSTFQPPEDDSLLKL